MLSAFRELFVSRRMVRRNRRMMMTETLESRQLLAVTPKLSISDIAIVESDSGLVSAEAEIQMDMAWSAPVSFRLQSRNRTSVAGVDYVPVNGVWQIMPGQLSVRVPIQVRGDLIDEANEQFELVLSTVRRGIGTIGRGVATVTIEDNDAPPVVSVADVQIVEGGLAIVPIRLSSASSLPVSLKLKAVDESASSTSDYFAPVSSIVIPAGATSASLIVVTRHDLADEVDETFRLELSSVVNAAIVDDNVTVTIVDNDATPKVSIQNTSLVEGNVVAQTTALKITLSAISGMPVTVRMQTEDRLAKNGVDYLLNTETITIPAGLQSVAVPLTVRGNTVDEPNRVFAMRILDVQNALPGTMSALVTITDDDGPLLPLFTPGDMKYLGAFRLPSGPNGSSSFEFSGNSLAWNPANGSLFTGANVNEGLHLAEFQVPQKLGVSTNAALLPEARVLQSFTNLSSLLTVDAGGIQQPPLLDYMDLNIGGLLVTNGGLTGGMFMGYRGENPEESTHTHFRTSTLDLASLTSSTMVGLQDIRPSGSDLRGRLLGGYMAAVPRQWQNWIGAEFVTGAAGLNRIQSSSSGPALFGFDANSPSASLRDPLVYYPFGKALQWGDPVGAGVTIPLPLFNGTTKVEGVAFVPGTRSVIFLGSNGLSQIGYGEGSEFRDKARIYKGYHALNGSYKYQIWAYDLDDFASVRNGVKQAWEIRPTTVMNFDLPTPEPSKYFGGTAFDPATGRLFVSQKYAGPEYTPVIHVYQLGRGNFGA